MFAACRLAVRLESAPVRPGRAAAQKKNLKVTTVVRGLQQATVSHTELLSVQLPD